MRVLLDRVPMNPFYLIRERIKEGIFLMKGPF